MYHPTQHTIAKTIEFTGLDPYGGSRVNVTLTQAPDDTGVVFKTPKGSVEARLEYATVSGHSVLLSNGAAKVINVEHILATLYAYGVDNVYVDIERVPSRSFSVLQRLRLATDIEVLPNPENRERTLCDKLDEAGLKQGAAPRKFVTLDGPIGNHKLWFEPVGIDGLIMRAITSYIVPGQQEIQFPMAPGIYRNELSESRAYSGIPLPPSAANVVASLLHPSFGLGHGYTESNIFLPAWSEEEWHRRENYPCELARHAIVDRLGAIALLPGRLIGVKVTMNRSGHRNDMKVLKENAHRFKLAA